MDLLRPLRALGMMSGSSLDGVNAAVITTDGVDIFDFGPVLDVPYEDELREKLRYCHRHYKEIAEAEKQSLSEEITRFHAAVAQDIINDYGENLDIIGFHGHNLAHEPDEHIICQLGDGQLLANLTGIRTVSRFRQADMLSGGQGAPISAVYHQALTCKLEKPVAIVDIGGISSLTWIGANGEMQSFDAGPGNNAINDWVFKHGGQHMDYNGKLAALGHIHTPIICQLMHHKFLAKNPPKAANKETFSDKLEHLEGLSLEDGAATATCFVAEAIAYSMALFLPEQPHTLIVCGGGAKNPTLLRFLRQRFEDTEVKTAEEFGWDSSAVEAQALAYLAVRRLNMMPATYPFTTGVATPCICGEVFNPQK